MSVSLAASEPVRKSDGGQNSSLPSDLKLESPALVFRSATWHVFRKTMSALAQKANGATLDVMAQPNSAETVKNMNLARQTLVSASDWFTFKSVGLSHLRRRGYKTVFVPISEPRGEAYLTLFALSTFITQEVYSVDAGLNLRKITRASVAGMILKRAFRWLEAAASLLLLPLAAAAGLAARALRIGKKRPLMYIVDDSWNSPLVLSHSIAWLERANDRSFLFASFEGRVPSNAKPFIMDNAKWIRLKWDPNFYRALLRAAPRLAFYAGLNRVETVHARSYGPAFLGTLIARLYGAALVFDTRGAWVEENRALGYSKEGSLRDRVDVFLSESAYKAARSILAVGPSHAGLIAGKYETKRPPVVITCSVETSFYKIKSEERDDIRESLGFSGAAVVGYCGSAAPYHQPGRVVELFRELLERRGDTHALILTPDTAWFEEEFLKTGLPTHRYAIINADGENLPSLLACMDLGIMLMERSEPKDIALPTKLAQYLAAGVPALATDNMSDVSRVIDMGVGRVISLENINVEALESALEEFISSRDMFRAKCQSVAARFFDIENQLEVMEMVWEGCDGFSDYENFFKQISEAAPLAQVRG